MTNLCAHYRVRTYEMLSQLFDVEFIFCDDRPRYWLRKNGTFRGRFRSRHLRGFRFLGTSLNPGLPRVLWRCRCDVYLKCINGRFALPLTYLLARLRGRPFVLWTGVWHRLGSRAHRLGFPLTRYLLRRADAVVAYGSHVRDYLISEGVRQERLFVAPHAVDNARYRRRVTAQERGRTLRRMGVAPGERVILYVGRLESCKGMHYLVDAAARVRSRRWSVVLAGEGAEEDAVLARARARGLADRVRALGYVAGDETIRLYAVAAMGGSPFDHDGDVQGAVGPRRQRSVQSSRAGDCDRRGGGGRRGACPA